MIQKQRREARKKEREAREAAEEAEQQRIAEAEATDAAKRVEEAQRIAIKAAIAMRDDQSKDENKDRLVNPVSPMMSVSSPSGSERLSTKSDFSDRVEPLKVKLKLVDGNVDKASVITEGTSTQSYPSRFSTINKLNSQDSSVSSLVKLDDFVTPTELIGK